MNLANAHYNIHYASYRETLLSVVAALGRRDRKICATKLGARSN